MKYLSNYMGERQTVALNNAGAFFAFSTAQFNEQKKENVTYIQTSSGMLCPKENIEALNKELDTIYKESIAQDIAENGLTNIIRRELSNHEAYDTGDIVSTADALADYPNITDDAILAVFKNKDHVTESIV